ncbi:acyl carrier protein [Lacinutrix sp. C3R15]|uniref:acyl carrier protein n=1 Tax=Flavobacteriaceae TaxID=49546 RepID=UPI001C0895FB|nr:MULTISPECIES: acyl carrier protein [Flavobacteriaceae]MBU2940122.1 acyl carrier protein [Lacinutrix sp. C3R15]MDO6623439.1 acyl carrier protein [Oceanihabitans sp. 1_MG-2023]
MKNTIINTILLHFKDVKPKLKIASNDAHFKQELGVDSLDMAEFIARIEQEYRIEIPDADWPQIATVNLLAEYIRNAGN